MVLEEPGISVRDSSSISFCNSANRAEGRPIDVIHGPTRSPGLHRAKKGILVVPIEADKQRFSLREFISRKSDKKGKMREQLIRADVEA